MIVAVDGPAGSGKGTVTKRIEKELGFLNLDTGATYRCVALQTLKENVDLKDEEKIIKIANDIDIKIDNTGDKDIVLLNGEDVSRDIRTKEVTSIVSQISSIIPVREKMVEVQRSLAIGKNVIVEGRDICTVVFPNADVKIYLDASEEVRAKRRFEENKQNGIDTTYEEVLENVKMRDYNDMHKKFGALKRADDAIVVDSSNLTIDEVVEKIKDIIKSAEL
ncbi:MAG: (d)CMP kinase [Clostridia bacterium]|nr:cytidylate kinase [Clostridium sp. CAG:389]